MHEQQKKVPMVIIFNHPEHLGRLCASIDTLTSVTEHDLRALAWLCMLSDRERLSALVNGHFITWLKSVPKQDIFKKEVHMLLALLSFLDTLASVPNIDNHELH